jgi:hypothetical protein
MLENPTRGKAELSEAKRYTITAALPYTNGPIHIGHLAGVYVPSDIYARYLRLQGKDVAFICGSDEHGVAISMKAKKEGITPQQVIDKYDGIIRQLRNFLENYMITVTLLKRLLSNCMMLKPISFWPIDSLRERVQNVIILKHMATNVNGAVPL